VQVDAVQMHHVMHLVGQRDRLFLFNCLLRF